MMTSLVLGIGLLATSLELSDAALIRYDTALVSATMMAENRLMKSESICGSKLQLEM